VIYLGNNSGTRYLYYDGANYNLNGANLYVNGTQAVTNSGTWSINVSGSSASCTGNAATATLAANSTLAGGLAVNTSGRNDQANQIVRTDANGYIQAGWINSTSGTATGTPARVYCSEDAYIRYYSMSTFTGYVQAAASGSWGINVTGSSASCTGNAATVTGGITTSNYTAYAVKRTGNVGNANLNSATYYTGSQVLGYDTATNMPGNSYGTMISINERSDTCLQLVVDYSTGYLFTRGIYTTAPTFSPWRTCLNDANYTSYAMPAGSSATNSVDVRAPIFYDSNNTAYYADLNNTGTALSIAGNIVFGASNPYITASSYIVMSGGAYFSSGTVYMEANLKARGGIGNDSAAALTLTGGTSGYTQINGSARSPIFYDSDNTGYYVDPASTSRMNTVNADSLYSYGNVTAYSDERLKKDWEALPTNFVEELAKIKSGTYTRIDSGERQVGVGAQSLQAILKEAVSEKEEYLGVHYGNAALASAVELAKEVVDLRARVAQLEALVNKLIGD
jgi:hypothetical protein